VSYNPPTPTLAQTAAPLRVAVLSDDGLLRAALGRLLEEEGDIEVTEASSAEVALFDPGADEVRAAGRLGGLDELSTPALVLIPEASLVRLALDAGAGGVLLRDRVGPHLVSALRAVRAGLRVLDTSLADELLPQRRAPVAPPLEPLTAREQEVVGLMAQGLSNRRIARRLGISEHTAKFHIGRILDKLDADTRTEAVVRALRYGMVML
jgi:DNA-binding NarL/FixJ family response regulator